jgi:copper transport protein
LTRRTLTLAAAAALAATAAPAASAHARLLSTVPGDQAVVPTAPSRVTIRFDDKVRPRSGTIVVRNSDRKSVVAGKPRAVGDDVVIPLRKLADGDYTVRWRVLSDDGHTIQGVFAFGVGAGRSPPSAALSAGGGNPSTTDVVSRFLFFAGLLVAGGTAIFFVAVWRSARRAARLEGTDSAIWALIFAGCFLAFLGASGLLPHHGAGTTRFGIVMEIGGVVAIIGATLAAITVVERRLAPAAAAAALLLLPVPSLAGHALDRGQIRPLNVVADALHVAAAAVWIGGLLALAVATPRAVRALDSERRASFTGALLPRLSAVALTSVLVIAATGLVRALSELSAVSQLWSSGYGRALIVKSSLLAGLVALGWLNRRRLTYTPGLRRNAAVELALLAGIVVAVAFLTDLAPGRDLARAVAKPAEPRPIQPPPQGATLLAAESGGLAVGLAALADGHLQATVLDPDSRGVDRLGVSFAAGGRRIGSTACGPGCYRSRAAIEPGRVTVRILGSPTVSFDVPRRTAPAPALVGRARRAFTRLHSVVIEEHLASSPTQRVFTTWRLQAPDRVAYRTSSGLRAVVIGTKRWDKTRGGPWQRSGQTRLHQPSPWWGPRWIDARALGWTSVGGRRARLVSFFDPQLPAWFEIAVDPKTALPLELKMTAGAHFMRHRYRDFNRQLNIVAPAPGRQ